MHDFVGRFSTSPKRLGIQIVHKMNKAPMADSQEIHALDAVPYLTIASWRGFFSQPNTLVFFWFLSDEDSWKNYTSGNVFEHYHHFQAQIPEQKSKDILGLCMYH